MREYVPIFFDWVEVTGELNAQEKGRLIDAIVLYAQGGDWQEQIKGNERYLFPAFRKQIDRANEVSEARAEAGRASKPKQTETKASKSKQNETNANKTPNNNNNKEEEKEDNKKENRRFTPPAREEVMAYISEKGYRVDADRWIAYYESNGWRVGRNPMKDWKAAVRTWATNGFDSPKGSKQIAQTEYAQREYGERKEGELPQWLKEMMEEENAG